MRKLIAALCHHLRHPFSSVQSAGVLEGMPDPERDEAEKWMFTVGNMPLEETVVAGLTLSDERASDPKWIARYCRIYNIRFADEAGSRSPKEV
jgi:hypothetical protein